MSMKWWRNVGDVQSNISGDNIVVRGGGRYVGSLDAPGCANRNSLLWFLESMSAAELQEPGRWMAVMRML